MSFDEEQLDEHDECRHEIAELQTKLSTAEAERDELREVIERICTEVWGYDDPDHGDIQDHLVDKGILVNVPASDEVRTEFECDTMYVLKWTQRALDAARGEGES